VIAHPVLRQPASGTLELVEHIDVYLGGSAANTGTDLARIGFNVALVGAIGDDSFGDILEQTAQANGLNTRWLKRHQQVKSAVTLVTVDGAGERTFLHAVGANRLFVPEDIPLEVLRAQGARVFHLAGYYVLPGIEGRDGSNAAELFRRAKELGLCTSLDCVWDASGRWGDLIEPVLPYVDIFCPSLGEAQRITRLTQPAEVAQALFAMGVQQTVALTLGADGAYIATVSGEMLGVPAGRVEVVDGTGAGDGFVAGMLAGWLLDYDVATSASLACAAGSLATTTLGACTGITSLQSVREVAEVIRPNIKRLEGHDTR